jgi:energy-coupling factor transporter ATP-binding protein EcfA2
MGKVAGVAQVKITNITITDTYGTTHAAFKPGTVTRICGRNGSGKSSVLRALLYIFSGGCDPSVVRKGAEKSFISLTLDDGTIIAKTTRPKRARKGSEITGWVADLEITAPDGSVIDAPQSYINQLSEALAVDPSVLLRVDATTVPGRRQLAAELMRLVPIVFTQEEIATAIRYRSTVEVPRGNEDVLALPPAIDLPAEMSINLEQLKKLAASVTEQRRRIGQMRDESSGAVAQLKKALPETTGEVAAAFLSDQLKDLEAARIEIEKAHADRRLEIEREKTAALDKARQEWTESVQATNAEIDAKIRALETERSTRNAAAKDIQLKINAACAEAEKLALAELEKEADPEKQRVVQEIAVIKERIVANAKAEGVRQQIAIQEQSARAANWTYDQLTEVLTRMEALRLEKLNGLPVSGLTVEGDAAYLDGIPWENQNTMRRVQAVLEICTQRSGKLPFLIIDDAEHADAEMRAAIERGLAEAGYQVIEAIVSEGPLTIETVSKETLFA